jgi:hypothetical protein
MDISLTLTDDERHSCRRAAALLRALSGGLADIATRHESDTCAGYAATLDRIVESGECCSVSPDGKIDVEQASFILEGIRDGLDNADLDEGADFVQRDIERLNDIVFRYNSAAGNATNSA